MRAPKVPAAAFGAALAFLLTAGPAFASGATTVSVQAGTDAQVVGSASLERVPGNGAETLEVTVVLDGQEAQSSSLCLSDQPFSDRIPPGTCPYQGTVNGDRVTYSLPLGTAYAGITLYVQLHIQLAGATAYAGWTAGNPFYGQVAVDDPPPADLPVSGLGLLALAGAAAVGVGVTARRQGKRRA